MMSIWLIFAFSYDRIALPPQKFTNLTKCVLQLPFLEVGQQSVQDPDPWEKINKWGEHCQLLAFCLVHLLDHSTWGSIPNRNSSITEKKTNQKHSFWGQSSREAAVPRKSPEKLHRTTNEFLQLWLWMKTELCIWNQPSSRPPGGSFSNKQPEDAQGWD